MSDKDRAVPVEGDRERLALAYIRVRGAHNPTADELENDEEVRPCAWCRLAADQHIEAAERAGVSLTGSGLREAARIVLREWPSSAGPLTVDRLMEYAALSGESGEPIYDPPIRWREPFGGSDDRAKAGPRFSPPVGESGEPRPTWESMYADHVRLREAIHIVATIAADPSGETHPHQAHFDCAWFADQLLDILRVGESGEPKEPA